MKLQGMTITTKRFIRQSVSAPDIGTYQTECIIRDQWGIIGLYFPGHLTRKQVIGKAWDTLSKDREKWSPDFLLRLKKMS